MSIWFVFKVQGARTSKPWVKKLGQVKADCHANAMREAFEEFARNYDGLAVVHIERIR